MIRNRFKVKEKSEEDVVTPPLLNEYAWDALAIAKKKLQMIPNDGQPQKPLTRAEQIKVDRVSGQNWPLVQHIFIFIFQFKRKVENAQYSRLCSRSRPIQAKKQERPIRELADSFGPFITVLGE